MSCVVVDLASWRNKPASLKLVHPAGVILPFDNPFLAEWLSPEVRGAICTGAYNADLVQSLPSAVLPGDRVLVIGAGLGVVSTLIAQNEGVGRVIVVEANTALVPFLNQVHAINGVPWVETINAVPAESGKGRVPYFARRDLRASSLLPNDGSWRQVMMVPLINLNLILRDEQISLVVCDTPAAAAQMLAQAELGPVERLLVGGGDNPSQGADMNEIGARLAAHGFVGESDSLYVRANAGRTRGRPHFSEYRCSSVS